MASKKMTIVEVVHKFAVLLAGEDTPELHAYIDACIAVDPPPSARTRVSVTSEEFDAVVAKMGGPEVLRQSALLYYGMATEELRQQVWLN